ncbi:hypothetical protein [Nitrospira sp. KM1]|uniref:hypothetical protein n=1 Tax=Nitrospira sp. KM1 TaxID=1936990 RepID=UPI0015638C20|nr:hypothetical protein [Nitrospira sp. KM1]
MQKSRPKPVGVVALLMMIKSVGENAMATERSALGLLAVIARPLIVRTLDRFSVL